MVRSAQDELLVCVCIYLKKKKRKNNVTMCINVSVNFSISERIVANREGCGSIVTDT